MKLRINARIKINPTFGEPVLEKIHWKVSYGKLRPFH